MVERKKRKNRSKRCFLGRDMDVSYAGEGLMNNDLIEAGVFDKQFLMGGWMLETFFLYNCFVFVFCINNSVC